MTRVCGSNETATGHGCMNLVADIGDHCAAGHKSIPTSLDLSPKNKASYIVEAIFADEQCSHETEELIDSSESQAELWVEWHQPQVAPFDGAEFYTVGPLASVHYNGDTIGIWSEGVRYWVRKGKKQNVVQALHTPEEFRREFPNGKLPNHGEPRWIIIAYGWFGVSSLSVPIGVSVFYSLKTAIGYAKYKLRVDV